MLSTFNLINMLNLIVKTILPYLFIPLLTS